MWTEARRRGIPILLCTTTDKSPKEGEVNLVRP